MIGEFPILAVAAGGARGKTVGRGAAELRVKESDRIAAMAAGLRSLGVHVEERPDGALIEGGTLRGGAIDSLGDHRIAMAFAVAGQLAGEDVGIDRKSTRPTSSHHCATRITYFAFKKNNKTNNTKITN